MLRIADQTSSFSHDFVTRRKLPALPRHAFVSGRLDSDRVESSGLDGHRAGGACVVRSRLGRVAGRRAGVVVLLDGLGVV